MRALLCPPPTPTFNSTGYGFRNSTHALFFHRQHTFTTLRSPWPVSAGIGGNLEHPASPNSTERVNRRSASRASKTEPRSCRPVRSPGFAVTRELHARGHLMIHKRVARVMRVRGLSIKPRRRFPRFFAPTASRFSRA